MSFFERDFKKNIEGISDLILGVREQLCNNPYDFCIKVALLARRTPNEYNVLQFIGRMLSTENINANNICISLVFDSDSLGVDDNRTLQMIDLLNKNPIHEFSVLFRYGFKKNILFIKSFIDYILKKDCFFSDINHRGAFNLLSLSYIYSDYEQYYNLCVKFSSKYGFIENRRYKSRYSTMQSILSGFLFLNNQKEKIKELDKKNSSLKIAICLSGQMREYSEAYKTWEHLNLDAHEVDLYIHTWSNSGIRMPSPISGNGAERAFSYKPFIKSFVKAGNLFGAQAIYDRYPSLFFEVARNCHKITSDELLKLYGSNAKIIIEDEEDIIFENDNNNQKKMFYKITSAQRMALESGKEYDLIIRLRPDLTFSKPVEKFDWNAMYEESIRKNVIFTDAARITEGLYVDDKFAVGIPSVMNYYVNTYNLQEQAVKERWYGFPTRLIAHQSLIYSLFYQGIKVENLIGGRISELSSVEKMDKFKIKELINNDIFQLDKIKLDEIILENLS